MDKSSFLKQGGKKMYNEKPMKNLDIEEYNKHKNNDGFLHNVVFAHNVEGWGEDTKALCFYNVGGEYRITPEMKEIAKKDYEQKKKEIIENIGDKLVFVGMGVSFTPKNPDYIGNHRIRTYFKDTKGVLCFVEFGSINDSSMRCDHALYNTKKDYNGWKSLQERERTEQRISALETRKGERYTKDKVLEWVNHYFDCAFKEMEVYDYFLNTKDYTSISPKEE